MKYDNNLARLIKEHLPTIRYLASKYTSHNVSDRATLKDELMGEGIVELLRLNMEFNDLTNRYPFALYIFYKLSDKMRQLVRVERRYVSVGLIEDKYASENIESSYS